MSHIPRFTHGAGERVRDLDHLIALLWTWREPEIVWPDPHHDDREHRRRGDVHLVVTADDTIIGLLDVDRTAAAPPPPEEQRPARRRKGTGPRGQRWPTTSRELIAACKAAGAKVDHGGKHWRVTLPGGRGMVTLPVSSSDWRTVKNNALQLHRAGLNVARF
jgi:hypothetical protein